MAQNLPQRALSWFAPRRFVRLERRDYDWEFAFDGDAWISTPDLWRLLDAHRIRLTSEDHGHKFGLPAPVDAAASINELIGGCTMQRLDMDERTLDLSLHFENGFALQIFPTSAAYESWQIWRPGERTIATGGGDLAILREPSRETKTD